MLNNACSIEKVYITIFADNLKDESGKFQSGVFFKRTHTKQHGGSNQ